VLRWAAATASRVLATPGAAFASVRRPTRHGKHNAVVLRNNAGDVFLLLLPPRARRALSLRRKSARGCVAKRAGRAARLCSFHRRGLRRAFSAHCRWYRRKRWRQAFAPWTLALCRLRQRAHGGVLLRVARAAAGNAYRVCCVAGENKAEDGAAAQNGEPWRVIRRWRRNANRLQPRVLAANKDASASGLSPLVNQRMRRKWRALRAEDARRTFCWLASARVHACSRRGATSDRQTRAFRAARAPRITHPL